MAIRHWLLASVSISIMLLMAVLAGCGGGGTTTPATSGRMVVLGYNSLGMHCMNQDFSRLMILPPYNDLHAQVIDRSGEEPRIVTSGVTVRYAVPGNTTSVTKTNFWTYAGALLGTPLAPDVGLTGNRLSGTMTTTGNNDWIASGVPITPITDAGVENPYQLASITVEQNSQTQATTRAVIPVSWEISCNLCHGEDGVPTDLDILRKHDEELGTHLEQQTPVACAKCHADPALGAAGQAGVSTLSHAMHSAHADRMGEVNLAQPCYACHPGVRTKCQRDIHYTKGITCTACHGSMAAVGSAARRPWVDEPRCGDCHQRAGFTFEQPGVLFRESKGHHGVHCAACHNSPHAITPVDTSITNNDNLQAIDLQGHAGPIDTCSVCHATPPDDAFSHNFSGGD